MNKPKTHTLRGMLCSIIGGVCWGLSGTCGQYLFSEFGISALWLTCLRLLVAGGILTLLALRTHRADLVNIWKQPKDVALLVCYGIFGLMLCQYSYMTSISWSNAATTTVLQNLSLVLIMLVTCLRVRRLPKPIETFALALAVFGIWMLATGGDPHHMTLSPQGLFWGLATAVAVAIYTLLPQSLLPRWGQEVISGYGMLIGGIVLTLFSRSWEVEVQLPARGWLAVAVIILLGTVMSFSLFMQGVTDLGPVKSSMLVATEPVSATILSALWLGTTFSATDFIGFGAIVATIFLLAKSD
ncbi:MAG: DMT family transporter [Oscillibacter sp.]